MRIKHKIFCIFISIIFIFTGCIHMGTGITDSSTPIKEKYRILGHAKGESYYFSLLGIFPFGHPNHEAAIVNAVKKYDGGYALINVSSYETLIFALVGFVFCTTVEGDVIGR